MPFVPSVFSKIGKDCTDLLKKKWDVKKDEMKHQLNVTTKAPNGVTITSSAYVEAAPADKFSGKVVVKKADKSWGEVTGEVTTGTKVKATGKLTNLLKNLTVSGELGHGVADGCSGKLTGEYSQESVSVAAEFEHSNKEQKASVGVTFGLEGLTVGVLGSVDTKELLKKAPKPEEGKDAAKDAAPAATPSPWWLTPAIQYQEGDLTLSLGLEKRDDLAFNAIHKVTADTTYAVRFLNETKDGKAETSLSFGGEHALDKATSVKGKVQVFDSKEFVLNAFVQHKLSNPNLTVGLSHQWSPAGSKKAAGNAFAVNLALGDA